MDYAYARQARGLGRPVRMHSLRLLNVDSFEAIELAAVERFLESAGSESLLWEAKSDGVGGQLRTEHVQKTVCAFANQVGGMFLVGVRETNGEWFVDGVDSPSEDFELWLTQAIELVSPVPQTATKVFELVTGKKVAVVDVAPTSVTPCMTRSGEVFERVSGKSERVIDPTRLAALLDRGMRARETAESEAIRALDEILLGPGLRSQSCCWIGFGFSATTYSPGVEPRLFTRALKEELRKRFVERLFTETDSSDWLGGLAFEIRQSFIEVCSARGDFQWRARANWDGSTSAVLALDRNNVSDFNHIQHAIRPAQKLMIEMLQLLGGAGECCAVIRIETTHAVDDNAARTQTGELNLELMPVGHLYCDFPDQRIDIRRWMAISPAEKHELQSVAREILRSAGRTVLDDDDDGFTW